MFIKVKKTMSLSVDRRNILKEINRGIFEVDSIEHLDCGKSVKISAYLYGSHVPKFDFDLYLSAQDFETNIIVINSYSDEIIANLV
ncbi:hypothetical protein [Aquirufa nivalisilvae]